VSDRYPDRTEVFASVVANWRSRIEGSEVEGGTAEFSADAKERLSDLGYLVE